MSFVSQPATESPLLALASEFSLNEPLLTFSGLGVALLSGYVFYRMTWGDKPSYRSIPAIGGSDLISSYRSALKFTTHARYMVQAGYDKYKGGVFRVPQLNRWIIIISGRKKIEEVAQAPTDVFDINDAMEEIVFVKHLIGPTIMSNPYHVELARGSLTRNLGNLFDGVKEEIQLAFEEHIPATDEWRGFFVFPAITQIVARATSRVFVGLPLCRNPDYLNLSIKFTHDVGHSRYILEMTPGFLRGIAARLLSSAPKTTQLTHKYLEPVIEERQRRIDEYGSDYPDKPNDFLSWLMDAAEGEERTSLMLTNRIITLNFVAFHTSSLTFTHALYHLAAEPKYLAPLRQEVESVVKENGWSKVSLTKMHKLDSFLRESQRINPIDATSVLRKVLRDYTFSDGTFVPKGALITAAAQSTHLDDAIYPNASTFDGFRFNDMREKTGKGITSQFVATSPDYIGFGHAKHACPGRFFAANELKLMLAHLVLDYDVKMEKEGVRPPNVWRGFTCVPDLRARVMLRRRQT